MNKKMLLCKNYNQNACAICKTCEEMPGDWQSQSAFVTFEKLNRVRKLNNRGGRPQYSIHVILSV